MQVLHINYSLYISYGVYRENFFNNRRLLEFGIIAYMYIFMALIFGWGVILLGEIRYLSLLGVKGFRHPTKITFGLTSKMRSEFAKDCVILTTDKSKTILLVKWQHLWGILEFDSNCGNWTEGSHTIVHCIQIGIASVQPYYE